jgi:hypothetical protein
MIRAIPPSARREPSPGRSDAQVPRVQAVARAIGISSAETRVRRGELRRVHRGFAGAGSLGWPGVGLPIRVVGRLGPAVQGLRPAVRGLGPAVSASRHPAAAARWSAATAIAATAIATA